MVINYSAVVLDEISHTKLILLLGKYFPEESKTWREYAHHMTICMGELPTEQKKFLGKKVQMIVFKIGKSDKAIAVELQKGWGGAELTANKIPHVTLAVNPNGGKPVMSNQITDWKPIDHQFMIDGIVQEISR